MKALDFWLNLIMPPRLGVAAAAVAAGATAAASAASSMAQSDAAGDAADAQTYNQMLAMQAANRAGSEANTILNPYESQGQYANYALGNELGIVPGMPERPVEKDYQYFDPMTGQMVTNWNAFRKAMNQYDKGLASAAQYGSLKLDAMPSASDDKYRKKDGKFNNKLFAKDMKTWDDDVKRAAHAAGMDDAYKAAPKREDFMEPVLNKNGKKVRNPDGTVKKRFNNEKWNAALDEHKQYVQNQGAEYYKNYNQSAEGKARGNLLKEYGAADYAKDPMHYSTDLSMKGFSKDPGYTPMVYDEASWQASGDPTYLKKQPIIGNEETWKAANVPGYLEKKGIITNDAEWKASGDPTYMGPVNTLADLQKTPGYMFGLNQGLDSAQTSAAAGGSLMSGATLKALSDYGSGYASQKWMDYANMQADRFNQAYSRSMDYDKTRTNNFMQAFDRSMQYDNTRAARFNDAFQRGQGAYLNYFNRANSAYQNAFNRNMQNKQFRLGALEQQQNVGLNSASQQSHNTMQTGAQTQQGYQNIGNAQAQGYINQGQAQANAITGVSNALNNGYGNVMTLIGTSQNPNSRTSG